MPSQEFIDLFGEEPTRTAPGESFWDLQARRVSYRQHVRHWDRNIRVLEFGLLFPRAKDFLAAFGLTGTLFTSDFRSGMHLTLEETSGFDIWEDWTPNDADDVVVAAQARLISHGVKPDPLYPNPGLELMYSQKFGQTS